MHDSAITRRRLSRKPPIPIIEDIHTKVYKAARKPGALNMYGWHASCGTIHCRAGWVVHLAGEAGYALEKYFRRNLEPTADAAMEIYHASSPGLPVDRTCFYEDNTDALDNMRRMAKLEQAAKRYSVDDKGQLVKVSP